MRRQLLGQGLVALALVAGCAIGVNWFFDTFEKVVVQEVGDYRGEARFNAFYAAELLLREVDIEADSRASLTPTQWLPETADTLVVRASPAIASPGERAPLRAWVFGGGHLVLLAQPGGRIQLVDELIADLGYRLVEIDPDAADADDDTRAEETDDAEDGDFAYSLDLDMAPWRIETDDGHTDTATLTDDLGVVAARRDGIDGVITLVASSRFFENDWLDESDHARFLLDTVAGHIPPGKVWFIYDASFPPLWRLIWDNASYVVIGAALLLAAWLWSALLKFGPTLADDSPVRRSIVEHIAAAGRFVRRYHGTRELATATVAALLHRAELRHPGISRLPIEQQARLIARMTRLPAQSVADALADGGELGPREFTHKIQTLQAMRKAL